MYICKRAFSTYLFECSLKVHLLACQHMVSWTLLVHAHACVFGMRWHAFLKQHCQLVLRACTCRHDISLALFMCAHTCV